MTEGGKTVRNKNRRGSSMTFMRLVLPAILILMVWGCGGSGPGSAGSSGSEDTGIRISSLSSECWTGDFPGTGDVCSRNVDVRLDSGLLPERSKILVTVEAHKLNPDSSFDPFPASVETCTITYKKAIEDPSSPTLESLTIFPNCTLGGACADTCPQCVFTLIDTERMQAYWNSLQGGINIPVEYPTHYIAVYGCNYMNNYGKSGYFQTEYDFWLADFVTQ
jgi:hypothetical protein